MYQLIDHLKEKPLSNFILLKCDVEVDVVAVVAQLETDGRISVVVPLSSVANCAHFQPHRPTFDNSMEVVKDVCLILAGYMVEIV